MYTVSRQIKNKASEIGFVRSGIAKVDTLIDEGDHLREWFRRGYDASMKWMVRNMEKRIDPRNILPNAKSIISVALNYYTPAKHIDDKSYGKISRYAWGDDYHDIILDKLEQLRTFVQKIIPESHGIVYADTGPVMDKVWAARAGIGWQGKHTNIISRDYGSWIFLGEIILDVELEYDTLEMDLCGTCTACIDACPTGALVEEYVLDSNKCISYLTIEHRGELKTETSKNFDNWVYGCDICQDVCPWNRFAKETTIEQFKPRNENMTPELIRLIKMTQQEFSRRFRKSPIKRTKHRGLQRNAKAILESQTSSS